MATKLKIELEDATAAGLKALKKQLDDLSNIDPTKNLDKLGDRAEQAGKALKRSLDMKGILERQTKALKDQRRVLEGMGKTSAEAAARIEELKAKEAALAKEIGTLNGEVGRSKKLFGDFAKDARQAADSAEESLAGAAEKLNRKLDKLEHDASKGVERAITREETARRQAMGQEIKDRQAKLDKVGDDESDAAKARAKEQEAIRKRVLANIAESQRHRQKLVEEAIQNEMDAHRRKAREIKRIEEKADADVAEMRRRNKANLKGRVQGANATRGLAEQSQTNLKTQSTNLEKIRAAIRATEKLAETDIRATYTLEQLNEQLRLGEREFARATAGVEHMERQLVDARATADQAAAGLRKIGATQADIKKAEDAVRQIDLTLERMQNRGEALTTDQLAKDTQDIARSQNEAADAIREMQSATKAEVAQYRSLVQQSDQLTQSIRETREALSRLESQGSGTKEQMEEDRLATEQLNLELEELQQQLADTKKEAKKQGGVAAQMEQDTQATLNAANASGKLGAHSTELAHAQQGLGRSMATGRIAEQRVQLRSNIQTNARWAKSLQVGRDTMTQLKKAMVDSAQAFLLNTRAGNEFFNSIQRADPEGGMGRVSIMAIGLVGTITALAVSWKGVRDAIKEAAEAGDEALMPQWQEMQRRTDVLSASWDRLVRQLVQGEGLTGGVVTHAHRSIEGQIDLLKDLMTDFSDNEFFTRTLSEWNLTLTDVAETTASVLGIEIDINSELEETVRQQRRARKLSQQAAVEEASRLRVQKLIVEAAKTQRIELLRIVDEQNKSVAANDALVKSLQEQAKATRNVSEREVIEQRIVNLLQHRNRLEQENARLVGEAKAGLGEYADVLKTIDEFKKSEARIESRRGSVLSALRDQLAEQVEVHKDVAAQEQLRQQIAQRLAKDYKLQEEKLKDLQAEAKKLQDQLTSGEGNASNLTHHLSEVKDEISQTVDEMAKLTAEQRKGTDEAAKRARMERAATRDRLRELDEVRKRFAEIQSTQGPTVSDYIKHLGQKYQQTASNYGQDSPEAKAQSQLGKLQILSQVDQADGKVDSLIDKLDDLESAGKGSTDEAKKFREELEKALKAAEAVRKAQQGYNNLLNQAADQKAQADFQERRAKIREALGKAEQQGINPLQHLRSQISDRTVEQKVKQQRQAELERFTREDAVTMLREKGVNATLTADGIKGGSKLDQMRVDNFMRGQRRRIMGAPIGQDEANSARNELTRTMINGLQDSGKVTREMADVLRQGLDENTKLVNSQTQLKQALDSVTKSLNSQNIKNLADAIAKNVAKGGKGKKEMADTEGVSQVDGLDPAEQATVTSKPHFEQWLQGDGGGTGQGQFSIPSEPPPDQLEGLPAAPAQMGLTGAVAQNTGSQQTLGQTAAAGFGQVGQMLVGVAAENERVSNEIAEVNNRVEAIVESTLNRGRDAKKRVGAHRRQQ